MNHWAVQPNAFATRGEMRSSAFVPERDHQAVVCPKPRRVGRFNPTMIHDHHHHHPVRPLRYHFTHQMELCESEAETDILDIILTKDGCGAEQVCTQVLASSPPFFCGSPPSRVANPLTQDARFRDDDINLTLMSPSIPPPSGLPSSPSSSAARKGGCVRGNFGNSPAVRIEGFDCLNRDRRNCSIPALA